MITPNTPKNEDQRLNALKEYQIMDTLPEELYDDITKIASQIADTPIALISLVDDKRQWFKSHHGLDATETPKEFAFCAHAINNPDEIFEIPDAHKDKRFHDNPLTIGDPHVRFYAGAPLTDDNGFPLGTLCVIDHKAKKLNTNQRETLLALSRQVMALLKLRKQNFVNKQMDGNLKGILENLGDGVFELDGEGNCIYANSTMLEMLNRDLPKVLNTPIWDMIFEDDVDEMKKHYREQFKKKSSTCSYTYRLNPLQKPLLWVEQRTTMQYEGDRMVKLRSIARDISENVELKEKLKVKESLFKLVSENSQDLIALHELNGKYKFISDSSKDLLGYEPAEMIGQDPYDYIHAEDGKKLKEGAHKSTLEGKNVENVEYRLRKKDGSYLWMESYAKPIMNSKNEVTSFQTSSRDISSKHKEREELLVAKTKAEEASNAKNSFLSMMSHEIRTPLNGIIGTTHLLLSQEPQNGQIAHLNILKRSGDNLLAIVNDILDLNKIEEGKIEIDLSKFNLHELVTLIHENYSLQTEEKSIALNLEYDNSLSNFYLGDSVRVSQVLHNLISNAIKFTNKGEVNIALRRTNQHDNFDEILFEIKDTGIGISKDRQKDVFNTFVQAEKDTTRRFGGSGLGLSITKKLLELMDSEIRLESDNESGSKFYFNLALQRVNTVEKSNNSSNPTDHFEKLSGNVLVVEDNDFNRLIARDFLQSWGCSVVEAVNGKEGLELLKSKEIDLVLLDLQMPVMDGFETIEAIRSEKDAYFKDLPVIALTASALSETREDVFKSGINDFITKPFFPTEFYNKVAEKLCRKTKKNLNEDKTFIIINKLKETFGDNQEKITKYFNIFRDTITEEILSLKEALSNKDVDHIKKYAHKIKSSLKMVGLIDIADQAEEIETMIKNTNPDSMILEKASQHFANINLLSEQLQKHQ